MENYVSRHHQDVLRKAEAGDAEAQATLGSFFFNGVPEAGLEPDFRRGSELAFKSSWGTPHSSADHVGVPVHSGERCPPKLSPRREMVPTSGGCGPSGGAK